MRFQSLYIEKVNKLCFHIYHVFNRQNNLFKQISGVHLRKTYGNVTSVVPAYVHIAYLLHDMVNDILKIQTTLETKQI